MKSELRDKINELYLKGIKRKEIVKLLHVSYYSVYYFTRSKTPVHRHNETYKGILADSKTMKQSEIVRKYGVSRQYVSSVIKKENKIEK